MTFLSIIFALISGLMVSSCDQNHEQPIPNNEPVVSITLQALYEALDKKELQQSQTITKALMEKSPDQVLSGMMPHEPPLRYAITIDFIDYALWFVKTYNTIELGLDKANKPDYNNALMLALLKAKNNDKMIELALAIISHEKDGLGSIFRFNTKEYYPLHMAIWLNNLNLVKAIIELSESTKQEKAKVPEHDDWNVVLPITLAHRLWGENDIWLFLGGEREQKIAEIDDMIENNEGDNLVAELIKPENKTNKAELLTRTYKSSIDNANINIVKKLLSEDSFNPNDAKIDANSLAQSMFDGWDRRIPSVEEQIDLSTKHWAFYEYQTNIKDSVLESNSTSNYNATTSGALPYALFRASINPKEYKEVAQEFISSPKITIQSKDLLFGIESELDNDLLQSMAKKAKLENYTKEERNNISRRIIEDDFLLPLDIIKQLYDNDPKLFDDELANKAIGTVFDEAIDTYHSHIRYIDNGGEVNHRSQPYIDRTKKFFSTTEPVKIPRLREAIPNVSKPAIKSIMRDIEKMNISEQSIIENIDKHLADINHNEPGYRTFACQALIHNRFAVLSHVISKGAPIEQYCGIDTTSKNIAWVATNKLPEICKKPNQGSNSCGLLKTFIYGLFFHNSNLSTIKDITGKEHSIIKLLIDYHEYGGANMLTNFIRNKWNTVDRTFKDDSGNTVQATEYIKRLNVQSDDLNGLLEELK